MSFWQHDELRKLDWERRQWGRWPAPLPLSPEEFQRAHQRRAPGAPRARRLPGRGRPSGTSAGQLSTLRSPPKPARASVRRRCFRDSCLSTLGACLCPLLATTMKSTRPAVPVAFPLTQDRRVCLILIALFGWLGLCMSMAVVITCISISTSTRHVVCGPCTEHFCSVPLTGQAGSMSIRWLFPLRPVECWIQPVRIPRVRDFIGGVSRGFPYHITAGHSSLELAQVVLSP